MRDRPMKVERMVFKNGESINWENSRKLVMRNMWRHMWRGFHLGFMNEISNIQKTTYRIPPRELFIQDCAGPV